MSRKILVFLVILGSAFGEDEPAKQEPSGPEVITGSSPLVEISYDSAPADNTEDKPSPDNKEKPQLEKQAAELPEKQALDNLIADRQKVISIYQQCSNELSEGRKSQVISSINNDLVSLRTDMEGMRKTADSRDKEIITKLYNEVCSKRKNDSADVKDTFAFYETLVKFFRDALASNVKNPGDLNTPFWIRIKQFFTDPFNFLGVSSTWVDQVVGNPSSQPDEVEKFKMEELLKKSQKLAKHFHICALRVETDKQEPKYRVITQSLAKLKTDLEKMTDNKSKEFVDHLKNSYFDGDMEMKDTDSAFRKYDYLYVILEYQLRNFVKNDTDLKCEYWKRIVNFLQESDRFQGTTTVPQQNTGFGSPGGSSDSAGAEGGKTPEGQPSDVETQEEPKVDQSGTGNGTSNGGQQVAEPFHGSLDHLSGYSTQKRPSAEGQTSFDDSVDLETGHSSPQPGDSQDGQTTTNGSHSETGDTSDSVSQPVKG